jgi:predicted transcriptional regulator
MTVAQELTRMTPEVNHALLSAPGVMMKGDQGPKGRCYKKTTKKAKSTPSDKQNRYTANQRMVIDFLRENGPSESGAIKKGLGIKRPCSTINILAKKQMVEVIKGGACNVYQLTEKGQTAEIKKTMREECEDAMHEFGEFSMTDLLQKTKKYIAEKAISSMREHGRIEVINGTWPIRYRWVK